jgi:hypothetical protein
VLAKTKCLRQGVCSIHKLRPELLGIKMQVIVEGQMQDVFANVFSGEVNVDTEKFRPRRMAPPVIVPPKGGLKHDS